MLPVSNLPVDTPKWTFDFIVSLNTKAYDLLDKVQTADDALRAAGAWQLLKYAGVELELVIARDEAQKRKLNSQMNAR